MKKQNNYIVPYAMEHTARLRMSILAGSDNPSGSGGEGSETKQLINWDKDLKVDSFD